VLVGGFGIIFRRSMLDLPNIGCVNMHSSLLPKHRGPNPFCAVILTGEQESGVTFHIMEEKIDAGDILEQASFPLTPEDTPYSVHAKSCALAADLVIPVMDHIQAEGLHGIPQDASHATYDKKPTQADACIHWDASAEQIERQVRALRSIHSPWFSHRGKTVHVTQVNVDYDDSNTAPGTVLSNKPYVRIAVRSGAVNIVSAYTTGAIPFPWPMPWHRPNTGESLMACE
nr:formyltransferase family protein [Candidatus Hydrogenedentota bacterium]